MIEKDKIRIMCEEIEKEQKIKILFCVENGSRAWNMSSKDSDYDIRFVYKRNVESYLSLNKSPEVITKSYNKEGIPCEAKGCEYDILGFDLYKFSRMLQSSNPTTIEWLMSPILYYGTVPDKLYSFATEQYNPMALYHHYRSMCRQNYDKYLKSGKFLTYKKYLYAMRGLVNAKYVLEVGELPEIDFLDMLDTVDRYHEGWPVAPKKVTDKLREIIRLKTTQKEKDITENVVMLDSYIEEFLSNKQEPAPRKSYTDYLDKYVVEEVQK